MGKAEAGSLLGSGRVGSRKTDGGGVVQLRCLGARPCLSGHIGFWFLRDLLQANGCMDDCPGFAGRTHNYRHRCPNRRHGIDFHLDERSG